MDTSGPSYLLSVNNTRSLSPVGGFTEDQLALQAHIKAANDKFEAACRARGCEFYGLLVDDPAHWARQGVFTVAEYESCMLRGEFSDRYKEENGFRPDLSRWTEEAMVEWLARLRSEAV